MRVSVENWFHRRAAHGALRATYVSEADALRDWAIVWPGQRKWWVVALHGHGSGGDQLFERQDIAEAWLPQYRRHGLGVLSPNLRDNAWMGASAALDLRGLLGWVRVEFGAERFLFISGSMGATSNLIYAAQRPEDVAAVGARCPATDIGSYYAWLCEHPGGARDEIRDAIARAYEGTPDQRPETYEAHSALRHANRLTMPLHVVHGDADPTIPVEQSRRLAEALVGAPNLTYVELPGGNHSAPLLQGGGAEWLDELIAGYDQPARAGE